jgi:hypothetical protein
MFRTLIFTGVFAVSFAPAFARHGGHEGCEHGCGYGYREHTQGHFHHRGGMVWQRSRHHRGVSERDVPRTLGPQGHQ